MHADVDEIIRHTVDEMGVMWAEFATKKQGKRAVAKINGQTALGQYKLMVEIVEDGSWPAMEATQGGQRHKKRKHGGDGGDG